MIQMTTKTDLFQKTATYKPNHTTFGGLIFPSDFNTEHRGKTYKNGSPIASRIIADRNFDRLCMNNQMLCEKTDSLNGNGR